MKTAAPPALGKPPAPAAANKAPPGPASPTGAKPPTAGGAKPNAPPAPPATAAAAKPKPVAASAQPQIDATFGENTYVFVPDSDQCYLPAKVVRTFKQGDDAGDVEVNGKKMTLGKQQTKDCMLMDSQSLESVDNMVEFRVLNEASLLHNLRLRYYQDEIYTTIGDILVSVNPFKMVEIYTPDVMDMYIRRKTKAPHVYRIADSAFRAMTDTRKAQSCIVAGESGAGKTEATKVFLQYLAEVSSRNSKAPSVAAPNEGAGGSSLQDKILEANPLLEAFGNAKTVRNDNSSRFGKWIEVKFDYTSNTITGGSITSYLLEKTRVVFVTDGERNYHIFYQLCAGAGLDKSLRTKYCLSNAATDYYYLNQSSCVEVEEINDARGWHHTAKAMEVVGIGERAKEVYATLAGILHLGNVNFGQGDKAAVAALSADSLDFAAQCLGFQKEDLERALVKRDVSVRGEKIFKENNPFQAGLQRDGLAKAVYGLLFDWLLNAVNQSLRTAVMDEDDAIRAQNNALMQQWEQAMAAHLANPKKIGGATGPKQPELKKSKLASIGVLDIFGFESFKRNSFEQLCINYCNEKLQGHFNSFVFTLEQSVYSAEGLDVSQIEFKDNSIILECLEMKKKGIFSIIDEEGVTPNTTDLTLLKKVMDVNPDLIRKPDMNAIRANPEMANVFIVVHYAGNVGYNIEGFLEKNKDELAPELTALLENSQREFVLELHDTSLVEEEERQKKLQNDNQSVGGKSTPSSRGDKRQSLGSKFKDQLTLLMTTLNQTSPHFVRCIKPNMEKVAEVFTAPMVLSQLRYSGLLEVCRIRQNGYPVQKPFGDYAFRYGPLCNPPVTKRGDHVAVAAALERQNLIPERRTGMWQLGKTKVFMRQQVFNGLERARDLKLKLFARHMQRVARGFIDRRKFRRYRSIIKNLREATKGKEEAVLEKAILDAGFLPYTGVHLEVVQKAHDALSKLKALAKARALIGEALEEKELSKLQQALGFADEVGLQSSEPVYGEAKKMIQIIMQEREVKQLLRDALQQRSLEKISSCLVKARSCYLVDLSADITEAEAMKQRLERIEEVAKEIQKLCSQDVSNKTADEVMKLVTVLIELGAKDHPSVPMAESYAKRQAEMSAAHAKKIADLKQKLKQACDSSNLPQLILLETEAVQLGVEKDKDVQPYWEARAKLERIQEMETRLQTGYQALVVKSELPEGVSDADIAALEQIVKEAASVVPASSESLSKSKQLVELTKKQIQAKKKLEQAMQSLKDNPNQKGADEAVKQAVKDAQSLGMQDDISRKGQAMVHLKTLAAEEKREMRRRSVMQGQVPGAAPMNRMISINDLDEVPEQPWLLDDDERKDDFGEASAALKSSKTLTKQTVQSRQELCAKRVELANSAEWNEVLKISSQDLFRFEHFIGLRADEDFTQYEPSEWKKTLAQSKCVHTTRIIPKSLLKLDDEWSEESVKVFKSILGWAGDQNAQFPQTLAVSVLKNGLQMQPIRDEIYLQLLKQLSQNPDKESEDRVWLLLCLCTETFGPSREFLNYLVNFFLRHYSDPGMRGNYAKWCAYQLSATEKLGASKYMPEVKDVTLYTTRPPVIIRVHQIYQVLFEHMTWSDVPVWPDQDVGFVEKMIATAQKLPPDVVKMSGLFLKDIALERPTAANIQKRSSPRLEKSTGGGESDFDSPASPRGGGPLSPSGSISPATKTKRGLFSSMKSSRNVREPSVDESQTTEGSDDLGPSINVSSNRKSVASKLGAISKSFRLRKSGKSEDETAADVASKAFRQSRTKSFKVKKASIASPSPSSPQGNGEVSGGSNAGNQYVAVASGQGAMTSYSANDGDGSAAPTVTSQQVSRVPPPPFAPWPLPRNFFLGDVFLRLVSQDRLPFLTYQRKMFSNDIPPEKATFIQIMQDVVNNRLPIQDQYQIMDLACTAAVRAAVVRKQPPPRTKEALVQAGLFNYIPPNWMYGVNENYWLESAMTFFSAPPGSFILDMAESQLYEHYLAVSRQLLLFGASLFSVIHKDLPGDFVAAINHHGLHILTNDGSPVCIAIIGFQEMLKFGASSTFIWVSVAPETVTRLANLFPTEEDRTKGLVYLHTQQARELYSLLIDYSYWFRNGKVRD